MPPSPTAAAQRFTEPERTSPAAKMPGQLVSSGPGKRLMPFQAGASPGKNQVKVAMETPGRLLGTTWFLDADAFVQ